MIKRNYLNRCLSLSLLVSVTLTTNGKILAQVTADQTLETQVIDIGLNSFILGGTTVGNTNLFHSFASFNVPSNGAAIFINDPRRETLLATSLPAPCPLPPLLQHESLVRLLGEI
ncbi:hypothetical protein [Anabaena sp. YBS01]|uniref:two-partner secretion domain-containing protein n=1 Tax=Anabaena sp. YBS01 TaxID=2490939 RepID=UPI0018853277